jgi:hypothetical protein
MGDVPKYPRLEEFGAWEKAGSKGSRHLSLYPWKTPQQVEVEREGTEADLPLKEQSHRARQRLMQAMLDSGFVENRAELARYFGLSRARISQILGPVKDKQA